MLSPRVTYKCQIRVSNVRMNPCHDTTAWIVECKGKTVEMFHSLGAKREKSLGWMEHQLESFREGLISVQTFSKTIIADFSVESNSSTPSVCLSNHQGHTTVLKVKTYHQRRGIANTLTEPSVIQIEGESNSLLISAFWNIILCADDMMERAVGAWMWRYGGSLLFSYLPTDRFDTTDVTREYSCEGNGMTC